MIEYLLLELVAKLSNSISTSLNSGKDFKGLTQMKIYPLVTDLAEVKTDLKFQLTSKPESQQKVESGRIEERSLTVILDSDHQNKEEDGWQKIELKDANSFELEFVLEGSQEPSLKPAFVAVSDKPSLN